MHTFQTFTVSFKIKLLSLPSHLGWLYACFVSSLDLYVFILHVSHTFQIFSLGLKIKLLSLPSYLKWLCICFEILLGHNFLSRAYLATFCIHLAASCTYLTHISNFPCEFQDQIAISPKSFRVILCMFIKFISLLCFILHVFYTISQNHFLLKPFNFIKLHLKFRSHCNFNVKDVKV